MPINIRCPHCNAPATLKDKYAGKKVCCPECSSAFRVMIAEPQPPAQTPRPRIDPAKREALRPDRPAPLAPSRPNGLAERCLRRRDSASVSLRLRLRRWGTSHPGLLGGAIFALGLLLGGGIMLAASPSREKAEPPPTAPSPPAPVVVKADANGKIDLTAAVAEVHGTKARYETDHAIDDIGYWTDSNDYVTWVFEVPATGSYRVEITYACLDSDAGSAYSIGVGRSQLSGTVPPTGGWGKFRTETVKGELYLPRGKHTLSVWATAMPRTAVMNLHKLRLTPVP